MGHIQSILIKYSFLFILICICPLSFVYSQKLIEFKVNFDTLNINYCQEDRSFIMPVWTQDFDFVDSIYSIRMVVLWDKSSLKIEDVVCSQNTICNTAEILSKKVLIDPEGGRLVVEFGNSKFPLVGKNIPLMYLSGKVIKKGQINLPDGWITVAPGIDILSPNKYLQKISTGFVKIIKDTSEKNRARVYILDKDIDTNKLDSVTLNVEKFNKKGVYKFNFNIVSDINKVRIVDWKSAVVYDSMRWKVKNVKIVNDTLYGEFESEKEIEIGGPFIKLIFTRTSDSSFSSYIRVNSFELNQESCIYSIDKIDSKINANSIMKKDTISSIESYGVENKLNVYYYNNSLVFNNVQDFNNIDLFNLSGKILFSKKKNHSEKNIVIQLNEKLSNGKYLLLFTNENLIKKYKQITIIN